MAVVPAVHHGESNADIVQQAGYRYYRGRGCRNYGYRNYGYRNYGYRNYGYGYRRYGYGGYGYRPYGLLWRLWLSLLAPWHQSLVRFLTH